MSFGQRSSDEEPAEASPSSPYLFRVVLIALPVVAAAMALGWLLKPASIAAERLERAAGELGVSDAVRHELGETLYFAFRDLDEVPCDRGLHERTGKAAVAYYETLLEKPLLKAGLTVSYDTFCEQPPTADIHPLAPLLARRGLGGGLKLPWSCMPERWRTPTHRALQTRLEYYVGSGRLPAEGLSGTLALIARPMRQGALQGECLRPSYGGAPQHRPNLPVQAAPLDDWDRVPRRRRYY
jgi:hypothetical protein